MCGGLCVSAAAASARPHPVKAPPQRRTHLPARVQSGIHHPPVLKRVLSSGRTVVHADRPSGRPGRMEQASVTHVRQNSSAGTRIAGAEHLAGTPDRRIRPEKVSIGRGAAHVTVPAASLVTTGQNTPAVHRYAATAETARQEAQRQATPAEIAEAAPPIRTAEPTVHHDRKVHHAASGGSPAAEAESEPRPGSGS